MSASRAQFGPRSAEIDGVPVTTLERSPVAVGSAQDILERLERYAAARRAARVVATAPLTEPTHPFDAATVDLFPYDLIAAVVGCAATILASIVLARPAALLFAAALIVLGAWARRHRWFPSVGVNLVIGAVVGLVLVVLS
jgi:hypothetical protein